MVGLIQNLGISPVIRCDTSDITRSQQDETQGSTWAGQLVSFSAQTDNERCRNREKWEKHWLYQLVMEKAGWEPSAGCGAMDERSAMPMVSCDQRCRCCRTEASSGAYRPRDHQHANAHRDQAPLIPHSRTGGVKSKCHSCESQLYASQCTDVRNKCHSLFFFLSFRVMQQCTASFGTFWRTVSVITELLCSLCHQSLWLLFEIWSPSPCIWPLLFCCLPLALISQWLALFLGIHVWQCAMVHPHG